ncbi:MAG: leucine--tRNA ligase [Fimbriimonadaceae bacterium]|nr:leucine--tRNA ligase [Fimbriimonadaceae bacterium]QYK55140.1 MAG: leucine--tRNA ligase [Fimbriimonadaceae bacterium]
MTDRYEPQSFEAKWRERWAQADLFRTREAPDRPKFYGLDFFPYPSGAGLSVGHCRNYIPTDVLCRMRYMQGHNVLHPMGFDAFGLPAENEAIKNKTHPAPMIDRYAARYQEQMTLVGISYDWSRSFKSCEPSYYRWTQWIFELLYKKGLAYRRNAEVNWCPKDKTALANEEVVGGLCDRCGTPVVRRAIPQWFFKITDYAQRLIDDLDTIDWPEGIKQMQRNWIGRSEGVEFEMEVRIARPSVYGDAPAPKTEGAAGEGDPESPPPTPSSFSPAQSSGKNEEGAPENLALRERALSIRVFTTRIDTIFGVTFCVVAPEHPLVKQVLRDADEGRREEVEAYVATAQRLTETDRQAEGREKTGVFLGAYALNPLSGEQVPIYVADYVLMGYGTGAIMAVPGHDQRDFDFAKKYGIAIRPVISPEAPPSVFGDVRAQETEGGVGEGDSGSPPPSGKDKEGAFESKDGFLINSGLYSGLSVAEAQEKLGEWFEHNQIGERRVNYKLRDWLISRQRFWGCPIPVCYSPDGDMMLIPEDQLPVELPHVESYEPGDDGSSPLAGIPEFLNCTTPEGTLGRRETDTMGGFACSSWYFLRFADPFNEAEPWDRAKADYWMPVDCYVGGAEHAVMHLLYARFWTKVLYDAGLVSVTEPFSRLKNQGQVLGNTPYRAPREGETLGVGEDGILVSYAEASAMPDEEVTWKWVRMSKSKGNVVTPEEAVEAFGADALRLFELFVAPFEADVQWTNEGMNGTSRFLTRVFRLVAEIRDDFVPDWRMRLGEAPPSVLGDDRAPETEGGVGGGDSGLARDIRRATHKAIAKATKDIEAFAFNTYVSGLMEFVNTLYDLRKRMAAPSAPEGRGGSGSPPPTPSSFSPAQSSGKTEEGAPEAFSEAVETLVLLLSPGAPHSADELWESLGKEGFTYQQDWPTADPALAKDDEVTIAVQVNGKLRDTILMPAEATKDELEAAALASAKVQTFTDGKTVKKVVVVPGKLVNIVVG